MSESLSGAELLRRKVSWNVLQLYWTCRCL